MSNPYEPFTINTLANHNKLNAFTKILAVPTAPWGKQQLLYMPN